MKKLGNTLLGAWLILTGLIGLANLTFKGSSIVLAIIAIVAGVLLVLADRNEKISTHIADFVLGIWLIAAGLIPLLNIHFLGSHTILHAIALLAGVLVIIRR